MRAPYGEIKCFDKLLKQKNYCKRLRVFYEREHDDEAAPPPRSAAAAGAHRGAPLLGPALRTPCSAFAAFATFATFANFCKFCKRPNRRFRPSGRAPPLHASRLHQFQKTTHVHRISRPMVPPYRISRPTALPYRISRPTAARNCALIRIVCTRATLRPRGARRTDGQGACAHKRRRSCATIPSTCS